MRLLLHDRIALIAGDLPANVPGKDCLGFLAKETPLSHAVPRKPYRLFAASAFWFADEGQDFHPCASLPLEDTLLSADHGVCRGPLAGGAAGKRV